jgi:selenocysteine-specific translation elongation factor
MGEKVVPVSATEGTGIDRLKESIADLLFYMNK